MNILIAGDSWGCGEWDFRLITKTATEISISHKGTEQYFLDNGYNVVNLSSGNSSCSDSLEQLSIFFNSSESEDIVVVWFQTDPLRNLRPYTNFRNQIKTYNDMLVLNDQILDSTYNLLNQFNKKIVCIGGCSKLNLELINKYPNLIPLIPSVPEFLIENYTAPELWISDWFYSEHFKVDTADINKLVYISKAKENLKRYPALFFPDGEHPNRHGHKLIFEHLIKHENIFKRTT